MKTSIVILRKLILSAAALATLATGHAGSFLYAPGSSYTLTPSAPTPISLPAIAPDPNAAAVNRTLILLQQNSADTSYLTDAIVDEATRVAADQTIARAIATSETTAFQNRASLHYKRFVNLSDENCTRAKLLSELILQSKDGHTVDLVILGRGAQELLKLNGDQNLTGKTVSYQAVSSDGSLVPVDSTSLPEGSYTLTPVVDPGTIRGLLTEARSAQGATFQFKLRLVYMGHHFGATTNDDWLDIGAKVAVGCPMGNFMPEPMIKSFWDGFLVNHKSARQSSGDSLALAKAAYLPIAGYHVTQSHTGLSLFNETRQEVAGNGNLIFRDECQLSLNEARLVYVDSKYSHNFPGIYLETGKTYKVSAGSTSLWTNGTRSVNANGYAPATSSEANSLRYPSNIMMLMGERHSLPNSINGLIGGSGFTIGAAKAFVAPGNGFLNLFANDAFVSYGNNVGKILVIVTCTSVLGTPTPVAPTPVAPTGLRTF